MYGDVGVEKSTHGRNLRALLLGTVHTGYALKHGKRAISWQATISQSSPKPGASFHLFELFLFPLNPNPTNTRPEMESRRRQPAMRIPSIRHLLLFLLLLLHHPALTAVEVLSKSKLESCARVSGSDQLQCHKKVVINLAVPSGSSGGEASIVAELVEVEENDTLKMQAIRSPPIITINKSAAYALYELTYIRV